LQGKLLTPYRGVRYHLKEFGNIGEVPLDARELFNLRHSRHRCLVERIIGEYKRRFGLFRKNHDLLDYKFLNKVFIACALLFNEIKEYELGSGEEIGFDDDEEIMSSDDSDDDEERIRTDFADANSTMAQDWRSKFAQEFWESF